jgi:hypothetical protein
MNELVEKIHRFMENDSRASLEPGGMKVFIDENVKIAADLFGSRMVRVYDTKTNQRLFLASIASAQTVEQGDWVNHIDNLLAESEGNNPAENEFAQARSLAQATTQVVNVPEQAQVPAQSTIPVQQPVIMQPAPQQAPPPQQGQNGGVVTNAVANPVAQQQTVNGQVNGVGDKSEN